MNKSNKKIAMLLAALNVFNSSTTATKQAKINNYQVLNNNFNLSKKKLLILGSFSFFFTAGLITGGYFLLRNGHKDNKKLNNDQNDKFDLSVTEKLESLSFKYNNVSIKIQNIDITKIETEGDDFKTNDRKKTAIVNAANTGISNGDGVALAIENAAGQEMKEEIKSWRQAAYESKSSTNIQMKKPTNKRNNENLSVKILETGQSKLGTSGNMGLGGVIHTPGPSVGKSLTEEDKKLLISSYTTALEVANNAKLERIVFPSISTGIYNFPIDEAAKCAADAIISFIDKNPGTSIKSIEWAFLDSNKTTLQEMFKRYSKSIENKIK